MQRNSFLKPNLAKIIVFLVFILLTYLIPKSNQVCFNGSCTEVEMKGVGYPVFYGYSIVDEGAFLEFSFLNLILNVLIYYILSCLIVFFIFREN